MGELISPQLEEGQKILPVNLFVMRHGPTNYNEEGRIMSRLDIPLNERGKRAAEMTAHILAQHPYFELPTAIWSSPLRRCRESAMPLGRMLRVEVEVCDLLIERAFGSLQGNLWSENEALYPGFKERDHNLQYDYRPHGGESVEDVKARVRKFICQAKEYCATNSIQTLVCYTHFGILGMIYHLATGRCLIPSNLQCKTFKVITPSNNQEPMIEFCGSH